MATPEIYMGDAPLDALTCAQLCRDVHTPHTERPCHDARHITTPDHGGHLLPFPDALLNAEKLASEYTFDVLPEHLSSPEP